MRLLSPLKQRLKSEVRDLKRYYLHPRCFERFDRDGFRASLDVWALPKELLLGDEFAFEVEVELTGPKARAAAKAGISLGVHWRNANGVGYFCYDDAHRVKLYPAAEGGLSARLVGRLPAPNTAGDYVLEFDLIDGSEQWFGTRKRTRFPKLRVEGRKAEAGEPGFDYVNIYSALDLEKDYWTVVGPGSREEFESLGRGKMEFLVTRGLTPDSRILDVGCGTGQLAQPLVPYLSKKGLYVGTDIAPEAIAFCRGKYPQANFRFEVNGMTSLPLEKLDFHVIYLCSVFTHMYPGETRDMLKTLRGLLVPGGKIIADVFHSASMEGSAGTRSMVILGEKLLESITKEAGLARVALQTYPWNATTKRSILEFTAT